MEAMRKASAALRFFYEEQSNGTQRLSGRQSNAETYRGLVPFLRESHFGGNSDRDAEDGVKGRQYADRESVKTGSFSFPVSHGTL